MARREKKLVRLLPQVKLYRSYWLITHAEARDIVRVNVVAEFIAERVAAEGVSFWLDDDDAGAASGEAARETIAKRKRGKPDQ
jgi:hypothetical protein